MSNTKLTTTQIKIAEWLFERPGQPDKTLEVVEGLTMDALDWFE